MDIGETFLGPELCPFSQVIRARSGYLAWYLKMVILKSLKQSNNVYQNQQQLGNCNMEVKVETVPNGFSFSLFLSENRKTISANILEQALKYI